MLFLHRDLSLTLGNSEWDYVGHVYNRGEGTIERTDTLRDACRPDGLYGQGYAIATWAVRAVARLGGAEVGAFRAAQFVTCVASMLFVLGAWRLGRALDVPRDLEWAPAAALACARPFLNMAAQVTTDVPAAAPLAFAFMPLFAAPTPRGGALAGLLLGIGVLIRGNLLSNLPLLMAIGFCLPAGPGATLRTRAAFAAAILGGFLAGAAPRLVMDLVQTGRPLYHELGPTLRAVLLEGGFEAFRPEPVGVGEVIARDPARFARTFWDSYSYYAFRLVPGLAIPLAALLRDRETRRRALVALALVVLFPLGIATNPFHSPRYIAGFLALPAAVGVAGLDRLLRGRERLRALLPWAFAAGLAPLYALQVGLLADKYRFDVPEAEMRAAVEAERAARGGPPGVLVRPGVAFHQGIYHDAIRYRLRRLPAKLVAAPGPVDAEEAKRLGAKPPFLVLRIPIHDTGPSVLFDRLRGRPREVHVPAPDPVLDGPGARRLVHDPTSGVDLYRVD